MLPPILLSGLGQVATEAACGSLPGFASLPVLPRTAENATTPSYIVTSVLGVNASSRSTNIKDQTNCLKRGQVRVIFRQRSLPPFPPRL